VVVAGAAVGPLDLDLGDARGLQQQVGDPDRESSSVGIGRGAQAVDSLEARVNKGN
jgi:hypothetical protein